MKHCTICGSIKITEAYCVECAAAILSAAELLNAEEKANARIAELEAENERLKQDAARLDSGTIKISGWDEFGEPVTTHHRGLDLRAMIDEGMKANARIDAAIAATQTAPPSPQTEPRDASTDVKS